MPPTAARPVDVRLENLPVSGSYLGVGVAKPRLSWVVPSAPEGWRQAACEIEISKPDSEPECHWVDSAEQVLVAWPAEPLASRAVRQLRVRVTDGTDWSDWSDPVGLEVALLDASDWQARFVSPATLGGLLTPAPVLRGVWDLPGEVVSARLYVSAHGLYEVSINGQRVGDDVLAPGWTSYHNRLRYQIHDVTDLLRSGSNDVTALLGNGWWRGRLAWGDRRALYGDRLALIAQLEVVTADGTRHVRVADDSWTAHNSQILADDLYDGQTTDLRITQPTGQDRVETIDADLSRLFAPMGPPVRVTQVVGEVKRWRSPSGALLVDFGQNVVGWVRLRVRGAEAGRTVVVTQAEVLEHEELGTRPLRTAKCTDTYHLAGEGSEILEPRFTFHGFRYARLEGVNESEIESVEAVVIHSDMQRTGWFSSSHELLNRFHENVVWGMRGNFVDVPTDCPQRDERLGWTGDIQVFSPTAQFLFDSTGFLASWLKDVECDQYANGSVPFVVPDVLRGGQTATAWGDATAIVAWVLYQRSGDLGALARQIPSIRRWVEFLDQAAGDDGIWSGDFQFGDWLDPTAPPEEAWRAKADPDVIATAYVVRSARILQSAAELVGDSQTAAYARTVAERAREGFRREFVTPGGRILSDAQTVYALALVDDLFDTDEQRRHAAQRLADLVRSSGFRISTGFVGTPVVTDALANNGQLDTAYRLLLQTGNPSWLYSVTMGATTVWERWDSMLPDGTINPGQMTSFNHYALGAVADWLHRTVGGLAPTAPGYRRMRIAPRPGGGLTHAEAAHLTPYGRAAVSWRIEGDKMLVHAEVPVGVTAEVDLPGRSVSEVGHGSYDFEVANPTQGRRPIETVRDLMDDLPAWQTFVAGAVTAGVRGMVSLVDEPSVADRAGTYLDAPVSALPDVLTLGGNDPGRDGIRRALEKALSN